jgi:Fe2+ or Zn2+ uptake regulation protein
MQLFFKEQRAPVDCTQILDDLERKGLKANKTTVYRQLDHFVRIGLVQEFDFGEGKKRYEIARNHHHHLICYRCNHVQCTELQEDFFSAQEEKIYRMTRFRVTGHMLEFFGLCDACQDAGESGTERPRHAHDARIDRLNRIASTAVHPTS